MTKFPEPPLERLPTVVMGECRRGFIPCLKRVDELIGVNFTRKDLFMVRVRFWVRTRFVVRIDQEMIERLGEIFFSLHYVERLRLFQIIAY